MKYLKITTALVGAMSLSACLGNDDKKVEVEPPVEPPVEVVPASYAEKNAYGTAIVAAMDEALVDEEEDDDPMIEWGDLPQSGSANYAGVMTVPDPTDMEGDNLIGEFGLELDFASHDVDGSADNFSNSLDEVWAGNLDIDGNFYDEVRAVGTLTSEAGVPSLYNAKAKNFGWLSNNNDDDLIVIPDAPQYVSGDLQVDVITGGVKEQGDGIFVGHITD